MAKTTEFFVIARQINRHGECDFLHAQDHPRGWWCLAAARALRFASLDAAARASNALQRTNPNDVISVMDMTEQEAAKPGFWTIKDTCRHQLDQKAQGAITQAPAAQQFDLSALPLFGDQARQLDIMDLLKT